MESTRFLPLFGRVLIGLPFVMSGLGKLAGYGPTTAYISSVGLPLPALGWAIAVAFEIGGGLLLIFGFRAREVATGLAMFTLATAVFFHNNFADQNQMIHFLKNIMIIGGLLQIAHFGAGRYSLDTRRIPATA
jgi:putative oxidoreductase